MSFTLAFLVLNSFYDVERLIIGKQKKNTISINVRNYSSFGNGFLFYKSPVPWDTSTMFSACRLKHTLIKSKLT